jgi:hypothetical protein
VGLEQSPLSLVSTIEELFERKSSGSGLGNRDCGLGFRRADHETPLYLQKLALPSPTSGVRSVDIVRSRTKATVLLCYLSFPSAAVHSALRVYFPGIDLYFFLTTFWLIADFRMKRQVFRLISRIISVPGERHSVCP